MVNYHTHTGFSPDAVGSLDEVIEAAIASGIKYLAITDHYDQDCGNTSFMVELDAYAKALHDAKDRYKGRIHLAAGIELGFQSHLIEDHLKVINNYGFDFILASQHCINREDFSVVLENRGIEMQREYIQEMTKVVKLLPGIHSIGHIDLLKRYFTKIRHLDDALLFDEWQEFFETIIELGVGIELNTSGVRKGLDEFHPTKALLEQYYQVGGRIVTVGADSHRPSDIREGIDEALALLKSIGFDSISIFENGKRQQINI